MPVLHTFQELYSLKHPTHKSRPLYVKYVYEVHTSHNRQTCPCNTPTAVRIQANNTCLQANTPNHEHWPHNCIDAPTPTCSETQLYLVSRTTQTQATAQPVLALTTIRHVHPTDVLWKPRHSKAATQHGRGFFWQTKSLGLRMHARVCMYQLHHLKNRSLLHPHRRCTQPVVLAHISPPLSPVITRYVNRAFALSLARSSLGCVPPRTSPTLNTSMIISNCKQGTRANQSSQPTLFPRFHT
jgi:hypothetical protein